MGPLLGRAMTRTASVQCPPCPLWELAARLPRSGWVQPTLAHRRWELAKGGGRLRLTQKEWSLLPARSRGEGQDGKEGQLPVISKSSLNNRSQGGSQLWLHSGKVG